MNIKDYNYLLGVYLGDGTYYNDYGIKLTVSLRDKDYNDLLVEILEDNNYNPRIFEDKNNGCYRITVGDKNNNLAELFCKYKTNRQKDKYNNGKWIINLKDFDYPEEIIAGIVDTDGSIRYRKKCKKSSHEIVIYQKHKSNLDLLIQQFNKLFLYPSIMKHRNGKYEMNVLSISHWTQVEIFKRNIPIKHPRKYDKLFC